MRIVVQVQLVDEAVNVEVLIFAAKLSFEDIPLAGLWQESELQIGRLEHLVDWHTALSDFPCR